MITALFYVSRTIVDSLERAGGIDAIVSAARARNAALDVTGALLFTGSHFAQLLEGPSAAVDELMNSIRADPRHRGVDVVLNGPVRTRRFAAWGLAYAGPASFVRQRLAPLVGQTAEASAAGRERSAKSVIRMMAEFVVQSPAAPDGGHSG